MTEATPQFRDIHIENVVCRGAQKAVVLQGLPEMPIQNITLKNISITAQNGVFASDAAGIAFENTEIINRSGAVLNFSRASKIVVDRLRYPAGAPAVAAVNGAGTRGIVIKNTDMTLAQTNFISGEVPASSVFEVQ